MSVATWTLCIRTCKSEHELINIYTHGHTRFLYISRFSTLLIHNAERVYGNSSLTECACDAVQDSLRCSSGTRFTYSPLFFLPFSSSARVLPPGHVAPVHHSAFSQISFFCPQCLWETTLGCFSCRPRLALCLLSNVASCFCSSVRELFSWFLNVLRQSFIRRSAWCFLGPRSRCGAGAEGRFRAGSLRVSPVVLTSAACLGKLTV